MLSWIYWNPTREICKIPFTEQPLLWYGFLFALGFYFAYYLFKSIARTYFLNNPFFVLEDLKNPEEIIIHLQKNPQNPILHEFLQYAPGPLKEKILRQNAPLDKNSLSEKTLLYWLNHFLEVQGEKKGIKRAILEKAFEGSIEAQENKITLLADKVFLYTVFGTVIGARLGHILFYENLDYFIQNPLSIFKTWEGGLASHGGLLGIIVALALFTKRYKEKFIDFSFLRICDFVAFAIPFVAIFIRIGNFFNQEILGRPTLLPWGVIFGSPIDGGASFPRHPIVLYEALAYLAIFLFLLWLKSSPKVFSRPGRFFSIFCLLASTLRFGLEFFKEDQSVYDGHLLNMGQILTIPFIILALLLLSFDLFKTKNFFERKVI